MIYGVDIGARRIAISGPDYQLAALILAEPRNPVQRRRAVHNEVYHLACFLDAVVPESATIWVEQAVVKHGPAANIGTAIRLGTTIGSLFGVHAGPGYLVDQARWKAELLGNGHASKDEITAWLWAESPGDAEACRGDQDLIDACAIRRYGELVAEGRLAEPWTLSRGRGRDPV